jgi:2-amino-4-hydroxy-6-hydroxymethyldihydropteridine diphosphokinase
MEFAYIGLGSNLADPVAQVEAGLRALTALPQTRFVQRSRLFRSAPWGRLDQPEFINAVAMLETALSPRALLDALLAIERAAGRERDGTHWGPRVLDLDVLVYGDRVVNESGLRVPHPHLAERAFVLVPLAEIAPDLNIAGFDSVKTMLARIDTLACLPLEPDAALTR